MRYGTSTVGKGPTIEVEVSRQFADDVAIALNHVAREVFDYDQWMAEDEIGTEDGPTREQWDDNLDTMAKHDRLQEAVRAFKAAAKMTGGAKATVRLPLTTAEMLPEALMHVRKYVFDRTGPKADAMLDVVNSAEAAISAARPGSGPKR